MKNAPRPLSFLILAALLVSAVPASAPAAAQKREHLTPEEIEFVRDAQRLDLRTAVFVKAAERRLALLAGGPASPQPAKDADKWGEVKGTRRQLFDDVYRILDEAVLNIDDTAQRDPKSALLNKSLSRLADAARRFLPQLAPLRDAAKSNDGEREALEEVIEKAEEIIEAAKRHDVDAVPEKEKSGKKGDKDN